MSTSRRKEKFRKGDTGIAMICFYNDVDMDAAKSSLQAFKCRKFSEQRNYGLVSGVWRHIRLLKRNPLVKSVIFECDRKPLAEACDI